MVISLLLLVNCCKLLVIEAFFLSCCKTFEFSNIVIIVADDKCEKKWPPNVDDDSEGEFVVVKQ